MGNRVCRGYDTTEADIYDAVADFNSANVAMADGDHLAGGANDLATSFRHAGGPQGASAFLYGEIDASGGLSGGNGPGNNGPNEMAHNDGEWMYNLSQLDEEFQQRETQKGKKRSSDL